MARLASTARPSSRQSQNAPQDVPTATAPARGTRLTRSQSRELSAPPPAPQQRGTGGRARGGGQKKKTVGGAADLTTVEENAPLEAGQVPAETEEAHTAAVDALDTRRMSVGEMSGTTAKTSFSQEEIGELDADVMVDVLPNLASASNDMAKLLLPAEPKSRPVVRREIRKAGTKYNKLYNNRREAIAIHKRAFGSTDYIQPSIVLRALLGVQQMRDVPQGEWRPDNLLFKINLAQMLRTLLVTLPDNATISAEGYDEINDLDVNFANGIADTASVFRPSAFQMCLSLLTQLAIIRMTAYFADPAFSPTKVIVESFYLDLGDAGGRLSFKHAAVLHMADLDGDQQYAYTQAIQQRVDQLTDVFNEADPASWAEALGLLRVQFSWDEFLGNVVDYYFERAQEIDNDVAAVGGSEQIISALSKEVDRRVDARKAEEKRQSLSRPGTTPKKGFGKGGIKALKAREKNLLANAAPPPATAPVAQMMQPDLNPPEQTAPPAVDGGWIRRENDEAFAPPEQIQSTARSSLAALHGIQAIQRRNAEKGKGRSFIDPQPGAVRVSFDDSQSQTMEYDAPGYQHQNAQSGPYYQSPQRTAGKRPYAEVDNGGEEEDFDPTQDQGFETDLRDTAAADQRRKELPPTREPQPRLSNIDSGVPGPSASAHASPSKRARKNPGSSIPLLERPFDPQDDRELPRTGTSRLEQARIMARHTTVMAAYRKPAQVRTPWSNPEEEALVAYIEQEGGEGISYATIKSLDAASETPLLARRSAEDLRFKARNMKETFLKGHMALPRNFERIVLDKKAIDKLRNLNIPYEQDSIRTRNVLNA